MSRSPLARTIWEGFLISVLFLVILAILSLGTSMIFEKV